MASAVDSRLAYARLSAVATASRLPTANRGSNNSYTTSWDTTSGIRGIMNAALPDLCAKQRTELVPSQPYGLMADVDTALEQHIFDLPR